MYIKSRNEEDYKPYEAARIEVKQTIETNRKFGRNLVIRWQLKQNKTPILKNMDKTRNILTEESEIMQWWKQYFEELIEPVRGDYTE